MKILKLSLILIVLVFATSVDSFGSMYQQRHRHHNRPVIGAPLDGGILAVLGVAGVAYYTARNKKKNKT
jgi:hypothetical protein